MGVASVAPCLLAGSPLVQGSHSFQSLGTQDAELATPEEIRLVPTETLNPPESTLYREKSLESDLLAHAYNPGL